MRETCIKPTRSGNILSVVNRSPLSDPRRLMAFSLFIKHCQVNLALDVGMVDYKDQV